MNKFLIFGLLFCGSNVYAEVYQCSNGSFSDKPCASTRTAADLVRENREREKRGDFNKDSQKTVGKYTEQEWLNICKASGSTARAIMNNRQKGVPMVDMMEKVVATSDPAIKDIIKAMVVDAYAQSRFSSAEYQMKAERDFENSAYLACIKAKP